MMLECALLLLLAATVSAETGNWVWSGNARNIDRSASYREESVGRPLFRPTEDVDRPSNYRPPAPIYETTDEFRPDPFVPRPGFNRPGPQTFPRPDDLNRPGFNRPDNFDRPGFNRPDNFDRPGGDLGGGFGRPGPPPHGQGVLTGPVPSWERPQHKGYKDFQRCKCAHSFNCESPGIKFGSCDVDKQYCCSNPKPPNQGSGLRDLPGSDGPYGGPYNDRPVLVGPGGPTGIIGGYGGRYETLGRTKSDALKKI